MEKNADSSIKTLTPNIVFKRKVKRKGIDAIPESAEFLGKVDNGPLSWNFVIPKEDDTMLNTKVSKGKGDSSDVESP